MSPRGQAAGKQGKAESFEEEKGILGEINGLRKGSET